MKHLLTLLLAVCICNTALATGQISDKMEYKGQKYYLLTNPMDSFFIKNPDRKPKGSVMSSGLWRGYLATLEVVNDALVLKDIQIEKSDSANKGFVWKSVKEDVLKSDKKLPIDWYTGLMILPYGDGLTDTHFSAVPNSENYLILEFDKGRLTGELRLNYDEFLDFSNQQFAAFQKTDEYRIKKQDRKSKSFDEQGAEQNMKYHIFTNTTKILIPYNKATQSLNIAEQIKHSLIRTFKNEKLISIVNYDKQQREVFSYRDHLDTYKPLNSIYGKVYNGQGKLIKMYSLHANLGLSIYSYEYDLSGNVRIYTVNNRDKAICSFDFVKQFSSLSALVNHPIVRQTDEPSKKILVSSKTLDATGKMLTYTDFSEIGDTVSFMRREYNSQNVPVYTYRESQYFKDSEKTISESYTESIKSMLGAQGIQYQEILTSFSIQNGKRALTELQISTFDRKKRLTERLSYSSGRFSDRLVNEYKDSTQQKISSYYTDGPDRLRETTTFQFNEEGQLLSETLQLRSSEKKEVSTYRYEYE